MHTVSAPPIWMRGGQKAFGNTLLQIENNASNAELISKLIARRPDLTLFTATDGLAGFEMARAFLPDVILLDMVMPRANGFETLKLLCEDAQTSHIPVMILTSSTLPGQQQKCLDLGAFGYLAKPYRLDDLMALIDTALHAASLQSMHLNVPAPQEAGGHIRV